MVKTTVVKAVKPVQSKTTKATSKKVAKNTKINPSDLMSMSVGEIVKNIDNVDYGADHPLVNYKSMPWINKAKKASEMFLFVGADGKEHVIPQGTALAMADFARAEPLALSLQLIAYQRGNPHAK